MDNNFFIVSKSLVNFCEPDKFIYGLGEIWNVLSSFVIVFFGLYGLINVILHNRFNSNININNYNKNKFNSIILYLLLTFVGFGSVYFHAKLSPFAHWVDIIFISIILLYSQYILITNNNTNKFKSKFKHILLFCLHFAISIYYPQLHLFLLFGTGFSLKNLIEYKIDVLNVLVKKSINQELMQKYNLIKKYFIISLIFWIIDYFGCEIILPYNIHVHWIFHIFIGLVAYKIIGLVKYLM
jgi:hypothetical protein